MRAHLFVPVLFAISSVGGVALAERSAGGGASHVAHVAREHVAREHVAREHVAREHVAREHVARPALAPVEHLRGRAETAGRPASSGSSRPGGSRTPGSPLPSISRSASGNTHCEPGSAGCGDRSGATAPARESHFTHATAKAPSAAERRALEKLVEVLKAKICAKAHCGEQ